VTATEPLKRSPLAFFAVILGLAIPIWALSWFGWVIGSLKVPVTDLLLGFTPLTAAAILVFRAEGAGGLATFLKSAFDVSRLRHTKWLAPVLLLAPFIYTLTLTGLWFTGHTGSARINVEALPALTAIMFLLAIGEEAGWTGYLLDPLQARFGALGASLIIAVPWWVGHLPSIVEIGGSASDIAWWFPGAIALRILMTWLYNNTGRSMLSVVLFHTLLNAGRSISYPTIGTHYDPTYQATGYAICFVLSAIVVMIWGPRTLTRPLEG
jgi:membrane protease YdiL (CAAX protease family)